jgi:phosphate transport system substrate-binding protein
MSSLRFVVAAFAVIAFTPAFGVEVDPKLENYKKVSGIGGNLTSIGSDTLNNLMAFWAEGFKKQYPQVNIGVEGKGSSTAPPALIEGAAQMGPMSRKMKATEEEAFEKKYGYKPTRIRVAVDALAVFVNKDNPIQGMTMPQVDAVFGKSMKLGEKELIDTWGQLGLEGEWAQRPMSIYGRNSASGTYGFFKEMALGNGDFKETVKEQPGSATVVQGVASEKYGIGYSGIGYTTPDVRAVPLAQKAGEDFAEANPENCYANKYPLSRFLYIYCNKKPGQPLDPIVVEFYKFILSKEGQEIVIKDGYYPVSNAVADQDLKLLTE